MTSEPFSHGDAVTDDLPQPPTLHVAFDEAVRIVEAMLFVSDDPISIKAISAQIGPGHGPVLDHLMARYQGGGIVLMKLAGGYALRTAPDLSYLFEEQASEPRKLSRAALETLAIIAYHQPVTRAEIEDIRGVSASKGTLDVLLETGWVRMRGRRRTPGRPVTYGTTPMFLDQFSLATVADLPGLDELKGVGLLDAIPQGSLLAMPGANADQLSLEEDPLDDDEIAAERSAMALWPDAGLESPSDDEADSGRDG